jgi:hypothetical protein
MSDPMRSLMWVSKSREKLADELGACGHSVSPNTAERKDVRWDNMHEKRHPKIYDSSERHARVMGRRTRRLTSSAASAGNWS